MNKARLIVRVFFYILVIGIVFWSNTPKVGFLAASVMVAALVSLAIWAFEKVGE